MKASQYIVAILACIGAIAILRFGIARLMPIQSVSPAAESAAPASAPPRSRDGRWRVKSDTNPLDDTPRVVVTLSSTSGVTPTGTPIELLFRCDGNELESYITWD